MFLIKDFQRVLKNNLRTVKRTGREPEGGGNEAGREPEGKKPEKTGGIREETKAFRKVKLS